MNFRICVTIIVLLIHIHLFTSLQTAYNNYIQIDIDFDDPLFEQLFSTASHDLATESNSVLPLSAYSKISNGIIIHFVLIVYERTTLNVNVYQRVVHFSNANKDNNKTITIISDLTPETANTLYIHDKKYRQLFNEVYTSYTTYIKDDSMKRIDTIKYYEGLSPTNELNIYIVNVQGTQYKRLFIYSRIGYYNSNQNIFIKEFELHK